MAWEDWDRPDPFRVVDLTRERGWQELVAPFRGVTSLPLEQALRVARESDAHTAVIETAYTDADYRSEYGALYSQTHGAVPRRTRRVHFFGEPFGKDVLWRIDPARHKYLGYMIQRPSRIGPVGRTMLVPKASIAASLRTAVSDRVNLFGTPLTVYAAPFMQQDARLGRCAHAAAWVCHYTASLRGDVARRPAAQFSLLADPSLGFGRPVPSSGLTIDQLQELMRVLDLPAVRHDLTVPPAARKPEWLRPDPPSLKHHPKAPASTWNSRIYPLVCRYLNSGYPVIIAVPHHAFALVGYRRQRNDDGTVTPVFIRQDDRCGPYIEVPDVFQDIGAGQEYHPWQAMIVPLPPTLWLTLEAAEPWACTSLHATATALTEQGWRFVDDLPRLAAAGSLDVRTYALRSNTWKEQLEKRTTDRIVLRGYRLLRLPRYIVVVELVIDEPAAKGEPAVIAEVVLDATSSELEPMILAMRLPGAMGIYGPSGGQGRFRPCGADPIYSGAPGAQAKRRR